MTPQPSLFRGRRQTLSISSFSALTDPDAAEDGEGVALNAPSAFLLIS